MAMSNRIEYNKTDRDPHKKNDFVGLQHRIGVADDTGERDREKARL